MNPQTIFLPNTVFRVVRTNDGNMIGVILRRFDGTIEDAIKVAQEISTDMFNKYPDASNIQSFIGIVDQKGKFTRTISPNLRIVSDINTEFGKQCLLEIFKMIDEH
jgi:hypothetical protein